MTENASNDEQWRSMLMGDMRMWTAFRRSLRILPTNPRCKMCSAPFGNPGGVLMRMVGKGPWPKNPSFCAQCFNWMDHHHGGAEVPTALLFADVRGSTALAEGMSASAFKQLLERFYQVATDVLVPSGAVLDKFVGDEVVAIFIVGTVGPSLARKAIQAGLDILAATGHDSASGPWIPIGVGVHGGNAYVGTVGAPGQVTDFTALGDTVNTAARLASAAAAGELLVTLDTATAGRAQGLPIARGEHRELTLKGKSEPVAVEVLHPTALAATPALA